jgi:hypothetical protein
MSPHTWAHANSTLHRNIDKLLPDYTALHYRHIIFCVLSTNDRQMIRVLDCLNRIFSYTIALLSVLTFFTLHKLVSFSEAFQKFHIHISFPPILAAFTAPLILLHLTVTSLLGEKYSLRSSLGNFVRPFYLHSLRIKYSFQHFCLETHHDRRAKNLACFDLIRRPLKQVG